MESLIISERRLSYKLTAVYAPGSTVFLALVFIALAIFQSASLFESSGFVAAALLSFWVAALFFEVVSFEVNGEDGSVCLNRTKLVRLRPISEQKVFRLADLNCVWIEFFGSYSSRLTFRFSTDWLPLTSSYSETSEVRKIEKQVRSWLKTQGLFFKSGEGPLPKS